MGLTLARFGPIVNPADAEPARMRRWMLAAGVKERPYDGKSAHALRHTCLTDVLESGANIRQVQALAGHSSLQTTQRYLGWSVDDLAVVVEGRRYVP